ncbi:MULTISPECIES: hypothetical protein [unclassified Acinetobacter]|uniref:DUF11 domain-containing protein n=1 Tax=Acinetobacter corruptisaponis TaxID=3045147 RepID=A0ABY8S1I6_9GAMM|nr:MULTISPECIES: hypothetical protein [unclassified Acinetobacter]MDH0031024.1 hypothetical protein [Acinetobacter sp. GD04021]MDH0886596.1 hypothetical protein [Acinetobacter sp. GD03873]MDH1082966.1 hypothetical protein [Acinetobacter sp. GD03983]MDH2190073.1 hypothetical protein [Acinetobacter sp. GD03645]MDH2203145.1 hypothetical protein [Acinetobacter sp. GD03647]
MSNRLQLTQLAASIALVAGSAAFVSSAHAAAPAAGTNISNIASASYTDSTGNTKTVSSNIVTTTVLPVASFTLIADRTANANANNQVSLSHTLTNTGNGSDTFTVNVADVTSGDQYDFSNLKVYLDANKDGVPDSQTPVTSVTLAAGESVNLIVQATTPTTRAGGVALSAGDLGKLTITAQSTLDNTLTATNTDTVKITNGAVISVIKSASVTAIDATQASPTAREVEYKLVYQNTGNTTATDVTVTDLLPAGLTYVANSAKLAGVTQTDGVDADGYKFVETTPGSGKGTVTLTIPTLAPNTTGTLTFKVRVDQNTPAGVITNIANVDPDGPSGPEGNTPSNPNDVNILSIKKGTINDSQTDAYADAEKTSATAKDNQIVIASIKQGEVAEFSTSGQGGEPIVIHNTGNVSEEFNIAIDKGTLPAGSIVTLYQADGVTPFVSTGSIPSGGTYNLVAKVTLPANYSTSTAIKATLTTSPKSDATKTDTLDLVISQVTPATVDLHNGDASDTTGSVAGASGKDTGLDIDVRSTKPNQAVNFPLQIDNAGVTGDNFNLGIDPAHALPTGWDVKFYVADGSGNPTGAPLTNTGNINGGSNIKLVAVVTPPANAPAGDQQVYFKVSSPATNLSDVMVDKVTVQADRKLSLQNDRIGQVAPGGTVVYKHTLTNTGNIAEGATPGSLPFTLTNDQSGNGWVTSLFIDVNNDGNIDAGDTLVTGSDLAAVTGAIARNASVNLLIKVQAPSNATPGTPSSVIFTINPTTVTGIAHASISNTDLTTVTEGQVRLVKDQALVDCTTGTGATYTQNTVSAKPGECVKYRIVATNEGNATVTNVVISDNTPSYTTLKAISGVSPLATSATLQNTASYVDGYTGTVSAEQSPLAPNASATLEFVIKVNPLTP